MVKIMIFLHGTTIMHKNALDRSREGRVKQVLDGEESLYDFATYIPVGNAVRKLQTWKKQGAEIVYLSSHKREEEVEKDKAVLRDHGTDNIPSDTTICMHSEMFGTWRSMIMYPKKRVMLLLFGHPCENEYQEIKFS